MYLIFANFFFFLHFFAHAWRNSFENISQTFKIWGQGFLLKDQSGRKEKEESIVVYDQGLN